MRQALSPATRDRLGVEARLRVHERGEQRRIDALRHRGGSDLGRIGDAGRHRVEASKDRTPGRRRERGRVARGRGEKCRRVRHVTGSQRGRGINSRAAARVETKVEVRPGCDARDADAADRLARRNLLADGHRKRRIKVGVQTRVAVVVADLDHDRAIGHASGKCDRAGGGSQDGRAEGRRQINTVVEMGVGHAVHRR